MPKDGRRKVAPHGTRERYYHRSDPCRCAACREANTAYVKNWNAIQRRANHPRGTVEVVDGDGDVIGLQPPLFD